MKKAYFLKKLIFEKKIDNQINPFENKKWLLYEKVTQEEYIKVGELMQ